MKSTRIGCRCWRTCPRQYQFYREYDFTPSGSAVIFFGLLVHQTIEEIHRLVLDGELKKLKEPRIRDLFERTVTFLTMADVHPIGEDSKESAICNECDFRPFCLAKGTIR